MANINDYLDWRGDVPLSAAPFNPADNLLLSQFAYMSLPIGAPCALSAAARSLISSGVAQGNNLLLAKHLAASERFGAARICRAEERLDEALEMQFAALVMELSDGTACVIFRGTDSTLVGWKEDLNMSFSEEVPSQAEAVRFLNGIRSYTALPLRVMGHSKGGNLAVYSSALCRREVQDDIIAVYNNDGPGLGDAAMASEGYARIEARVQTFLPQSSVVGMLLNHPESYQVIHADGSLGIVQHDPYAWETCRNGFICEGGLRRGSLYTDRTIKDWIKDIPNEQRKEFIDALYTVLQATHAHTLSDLTAAWARNSMAIIAGMGKLDPETRRHIHAVIGALLAACARNILREPGAEDGADAPQGE